MVSPYSKAAFLQKLVAEGTNKGSWLELLIYDHCWKQSPGLNETLVWFSMALPSEARFWHWKMGYVSRPQMKIQKCCEIFWAENQELAALGMSNSAHYNKLTLSNFTLFPTSIWKWGEGSWFCLYPDLIRFGYILHGWLLWMEYKIWGIKYAVFDEHEIASSF